MDGDASRCRRAFHFLVIPTMSASESSLSSRNSFHTPTWSPNERSAENQAYHVGLAEPKVYRPARQLPHELRVQCSIYLNEKLCTDSTLKIRLRADDGTDTAGIALLNSVLTAGASNPQAETTPALIPTPMQIEFIITLLVHPFYTSNRPPEDSPEISSGSLTFLRTLLSLVGPVNANFGVALDFTSTGHKNTRRGPFNVSEAANSDNDEERESMNNILASKESIRNRAFDFWHAVGWAFNCSIRYPERWTYWKIWLEFMLDVLEADWAEREREDHEAHELKNDWGADCEFPRLEESLLVLYLADARGRSAGIRRIIRSTFANGDHDALKAYPAVFDNEERSYQKRKFGEDDAQFRFNIQGDGDDMATSRGPLDEVEDMDEEEVARASVLGGIEAVHLRQRILGLVSAPYSSFAPC